MSLNDNTPLEGPEGDVDATPGDQVKDTFSELGSDDNEGPGAAGDEDGGEETVRDWPPLHMD